MDDCYKNLLFSVDLINYVMEMKKQDIKLGDLKSHLGDSPFKDVIGKAVLISTSDKGILYLETKEEFSLKEISLWTMNQFAKFVDLDSGFCPYQFISYCGMVCTLMESYLLKYGKRDVCEVLANAICNRLDGLTLYGCFKEENWENLAKTAEKIAKKPYSKKGKDQSTYF